MLIKCPECELQVSDKALTCPHCGFPLKKDAKQPKYKSKKQHKRLPNGFGQISELKGRNLRKPYRAMVTIGKNSVGRPIPKIVGFYQTYNEAYEALMEFNKHPYDLNTNISTLEVYNKWTAYYFPTLKAKSSSRTVTSAWAYCTSVYDINIRDLRAKHIKFCMDSTDSPNLKSRIKSLFNLMLDYALEYEMVDKNYARTFNVSDDVVKQSKDTANPHIKFTDSEMTTLWENVNINYVDLILIQCYTGFRPQELGLIKISDVDLNKDKPCITGGMKTDAGFDRLVPIHERIYELVKARYEQAKELGSEYIFNCTDSRDPKDLFLTYDKYQKRFAKIMDLLELNPEHRAHDPRKHFVSMAKDAKMDEYAIKRIAGHAIDDITEKIYTEHNPNWLFDEMKKIEEKKILKEP